MKHYPVFRQQLAEEGKILTGYVQREFEDYLKCGRLEHGFLRVRCENCHEERLVAFSCKHRGFCPSCGARRMAESAAQAAKRADITVVCLAEYEAIVSVVQTNEVSEALGGKLLVQLGGVTADQAQQILEWAMAQNVEY